MNNDLVVIGNVSEDHVSYNGGSRRSFWGGSGLNISVSAAQFGMRPRLVSVVGEDALDLLSQLEDRIDVSLVKVLNGKTCRFEIQYSRDGTLQGVNCDFGVANFLNSYLQEIDLPPAYYHVSCRQPVRPKRILPRITDRRLPFSLDFILSSARQQIAEAERWIQDAKYIFMNSQELEIFQGFHRISDVQTLIVTSSNQPVRVFKFGHEVLRRACSTKEFCDVTGAGDVFIGTFLASQFEGEGLRKSVERAILGAQKSLDSLGALQFLRRMSPPKQPTRPAPAGWS